MKRRMTLVSSDIIFPSDVELLPPVVDEQIDAPVEATVTQTIPGDRHQPEPNDENIEPAEESDVEEYSEDDDIPFDIESDESNRPMTYEQMEAMYKPKPTEPKVTFDDEDVETGPSDEESNEYSEENEYDDDVSDVDDSDLLKRLEEKYGKLPPTSAQIEDDDIEDDDDIDPTWTSNEHDFCLVLLRRVLCYRIDHVHNHSLNQQYYVSILSFFLRLKFTLRTQ